MLKIITRLALLGGAVLMLAACQDDGRLRNARAFTPIPPKTVALMEEKGMSKAAPILIRSFKKEAEVEIWKRNGKGEYALLKTYPICRWSGQLGPKKREGDRQAPEGFYTITPAQMNPNSNYYLSFDTGFPNAYDRANGYSGSYLMVHGACSSRGCFSMTDEQIAEIYAIGREAFAGGQRSFQFQSYPFRMTAENLAKHRNDPNIAFWKMLKEGSDVFEVTKQEPRVGVCGRRYVFDAQPADGSRLDPAAPCPPLKMDDAVAEAVAHKRHADDAKIAELVQKGTPAVRLVYDDGGQHPSFRATAYASSERESILAQAPETPRFAEVSRPEALERGPQEIEIDAGGKPKPAPKTVAPAAVAPTAVAQAPATPRPAAGGKAGDKARAEQAPVVAAQGAAQSPAHGKLASAPAASGAPQDAAVIPARSDGSEMKNQPSLLRRAFSLTGLTRVDDPATTGATTQAPTSGASTSGASTSGASLGKEPDATASNPQDKRAALATPPAGTSARTSSGEAKSFVPLY